MVISLRWLVGWVLCLQNVVRPYTNNFPYIIYIRTFDNNLNFFFYFNFDHYLLTIFYLFMALEISV